MRFIAEALGGTVDWSEEQQTAYVAYQESLVEVPIQSAVREQL